MVLRKPQQSFLGRQRSESEGRLPPRLSTVSPRASYLRIRRTAGTLVPQGCWQHGDLDSRRTADTQDVLMVCREKT